MDQKLYDLLVKALTASTHLENDLNCPDWSGEDEICAECKGGGIRQKAYETLKNLWESGELVKPTATEYRNLAKEHKLLQRKYLQAVGREEGKATDSLNNLLKKERCNKCGSAYLDFYKINIDPCDPHAGWAEKCCQECGYKSQIDQEIEI
jgi:hypothetical protein